MYLLGPCWSLHHTLLRGWEFFPLPPWPPQVFSISGLKLYFPTLEHWVVRSVTWSTSCCLASQLQLCLARSTILHLTGSASHHLASSPLHPAAISTPPAGLDKCFFWMSRTVRFSVSSGFLFLNCCCPSFGCVRRHSVSTYASILAGTPQELVFWRNFMHIQTHIYTLYMHTYIHVYYVTDILDV